MSILVERIVIDNFYLKDGIEIAYSYIDKYIYITKELIEGRVVINDTI